MSERIVPRAVALAVVVLAVALLPARALATPNPGPADIKAKLYAAAVARNIPPEILFGIAYQESGWRQFDANGNTVVSGDGGIGIMQVTSYGAYDVGRLKTDIDYNIAAGADILLGKWGATPVIGDNNMNCYENWFYAAWAYNGWVAYNQYPYKVWNLIAAGPNGWWTPIPVTAVPQAWLVNGRGVACATPQPAHYFKPVPGDGSFVQTPDGKCWIIAGGAPIYVTSWDAYSGPRPVTEVPDLSGFAAKPADSTFVVGWPSGKVYIFAGGAPIYVTTWDAYGGPRPLVEVTDATLDNIALSSGHVNATPADSTFVVGWPSGKVYIFAGGAPIYVTTWDAYGGPRPLVEVTDATLDNIALSSGHVNATPADGTFVVGWPLGHVYVFAGGAPLYVSTWDIYGGPRPLVEVTEGTLDNPGALAFGHALQYPRDGTILKGLPSGSLYEVLSGTARPVAASTPGFTSVDQVAIDNAGGSGVWNHLLPLTTADTAAPTTVSDAKTSYVAFAAIKLTATDNTGGSGVAHTYYKLDGGAQVEGTSLTVKTLGAHTVEFWSVDNAGNVEAPHKTATFDIQVINTYTLAYLAGRHGTIIGPSPQTVNSGGSGTAVTAVADSGYHFVNWSDGSTANPRIDTNVTANVGVTANFAGPLAVSIAKSPGGSAYTVQRHKGVASWTFGAQMTASSGPVTRTRIMLQTSANGRAWSNAVQLRTDSSGKVSIVVTWKKAGTCYLRWSFGGDGNWYLPATSIATKLTVK